MAVMLFVRIASNLEAAQLGRRFLERRPRFLDVPGLIHEIYGRDPSSGDVCGIYFFESERALAEFRETELARSIPEAYQAAHVRREVYGILDPLHPDRGPVSSGLAPAR